MAQLYKMTLYVCDLEDNLSLEDIKVQIKQYALDGVSINCLCHFSDEKIGKQIEWDDDLDLNQWNCPTEIWEKYFKEPNMEDNRDIIMSFVNYLKASAFMFDPGNGHSFRAIDVDDLEDFAKDFLRGAQ